MPEAPEQPVRHAAKKVLVPLLEILTFGLLGIVLLASLYLKYIISSDVDPTGSAYNISVWSVQVLRNGLMAVTLLLSFISLLVLPFKKKIAVLGFMILIAFLTRGLL